MTVRAAVCLALSLFLLFAAACDATEKDASPAGVELLAGIRSYQSVKQARAVLGIHDRQWRVVEDSGRSQGTPVRSRFDTLTAEIDDFQLAGEIGVLRLEFLNDRLMATLFYPRSLSAFKAQYSLPPQTESLRVNWGRDYQARDYLALEDARLRAEFMKWIRDNA